MVLQVNRDEISYITVGRRLEDTFYRYFSRLL